jgi:hypothetical protein
VYSVQVIGRERSNANIRTARVDARLRPYKRTLNLNSIHGHKTGRRQRRVSLVHGHVSGIHTSAFFFSAFSLEVANLL